MDEKIIESIKNTFGEKGIKLAKDAHIIDIIVRKDGVEYRYEGDWIKELFVKLN